MSKVNVLMRFSHADGKTTVKIELYKALSRLVEEQELIYKGKPLTDRMVYRRFKDSGKNLAGDGWFLSEEPIKHTLKRAKK